jgi:CyaY protein
VKLAVDDGEAGHGAVEGGCGPGSSGDDGAGADRAPGADALGESAELASGAGAVGSLSGPLTPHAVNGADPIAAVTTIATARRRTPAGKSRNIVSIVTGIAPTMMTETGFIAAADRALAVIGEALDAALDESAVDLDWSLNDGILELECGDGSKIIINRHVPNREIWVAARSGGFHFRPRDERWVDTRSGEELGAALGALMLAQAGLKVSLPPLVAPDLSK